MKMETIKLQVTKTSLNNMELENSIQHLTDKQWEWIRLQLVNYKLGSVGTYNMNITLINRDMYLIVREIKHRKPKGWYPKFHIFKMMERFGGLYELVKE
jgi:hypothetical protein